MVAPLYKATRAEAHDALDSERTYQIVEWGDGEGADNPQTVGEAILLMEEYIAKARAEWVKELDEDSDAPLHIVRKIGGIALNCLEQNGAPRREGY